MEARKEQGMKSIMNDFLSKHHSLANPDEALRGFLQDNNACLLERSFYLSRMIETFKDNYCKEDDFQPNTSINHNYIKY